MATDKYISTNKSFVDLRGRRFGRLLVLECAGIRRGSIRIWKCACDCGNTKIILGPSLLSGATRSCGCLLREATGERAKKHGLSHSPTWRVWVSIRNRCLNPKNKTYRYYGGRGIKVCHRWQESFESFLADMGLRPSIQYTIDRIDSNGDYEPDNCRWATRKQQTRNRKNTIYLTYEGQTKPLAEWAEIKGLTYSTLKQRVKTMGWSAAQALSTPGTKRRLKTKSDKLMG